MHRKMMRLARAGKCGGLRASGFWKPAARAACSVASPANARYPKPHEIVG